MKLLFFFFPCFRAITAAKRAAQFATPPHVMMIIICTGNHAMELRLDISFGFSFSFFLSPMDFYLQIGWSVGRVSIILVNKS